MERKWSLIFNYIGKNKLLVLIALLSGIGFNILTLLIPISIGRFYEFNFNITSQRLKLTEAIPFIRSENFTHFLIFFMSLLILRFVLEYSNRYVIAIIGEGFAKDLRERLFKHQLDVYTAVYDKKGIGKYLLRYSGDLKSIQNYITSGIFRFIQDILLIIILLITIAYINLTFGLIITSAIVITMVLLFVLNASLYKASVARRNKRSNMLAFVNTRLRAIRTIKVFNKYTPEEKNYNKHSKKLYNLSKSYQQLISLIQSVIPLLTYLMLAILMMYIYTLKKELGQQFNGSEFLILILLIISFLPILRRTLRVSIVWKLGEISFEKLINIFKLEAENTLAFEKIDLKSKILKLDHVTFTYEDTANVVFKDLSVSFKPNSIHLILGTPGSGKNTLVNLICKIYQQQEGSITFGEFDYKDLSEKTLRKNIAVVSDSFPLYGKHVFEAMVYRPNKERRERAAKMLTQLQQFESSKLDLDDKIGELGNQLTGGQKKLLMYGRAFLTNKPFIVIDEPFKDITTKTKKLLIDFLQKSKKDKTIILINDVEIVDLKQDSLYTIVDHTIKKLSR